MHDDEGRPTRPPFENVPLGITLALPLVGHARTLRGVLDHEAQTAQAVADGVGTAPILRGAGVGTGRQQGVHGLGAIRAGVQVVSGSPGTPSTEILETVAKHNPGDA